MASTFIKIASIATDTTNTAYTFSSIPQTYSHLVVFGHVPVGSTTDAITLTVGGQGSKFSYEKSTMAYSATLPTSSSAGSTDPTITAAAQTTTDGIVIFKLDFQNYSDSSKKPSLLSLASSTASTNGSSTNPSLATVTGAGNIVGAISSITLTLGVVARNTSGIISLYGVA